MAASPAARRSAPSQAFKSSKKKRRSSSISQKDNQETVIFQSPGLKPDIRLTVLKQQFHVHSVVLKLHSNFFRKFLDSPEKEAAPASSLFQYDYVSVVDADGAWGLEPAGKAPPLTDESLATVPDAEVEIEAFRKLLCAIYVRPYVIEDVSELLTIVRQAEYYFALPTLSGTFSGALLGSPMFKRDSLPDDDEEHNEFVENAGEIILAAKKLRHAVLFRECFIHIVANFHDSLYAQNLTALQDDKDVWLLLNQRVSHLRKMILEAQHEVLMASIQGYLQTDLYALVTDNFREDPEKSANFLRRVYERGDEVLQSDYEDMESTFPPIERLLRSNLALDQTGFGTGEGPYQYNFLCTELPDEDMPWDSTEVDW